MDIEKTRGIKIGTDEIKVVVDGRPDPAKGEKLVVFHLPLEMDPQEIIKKMKAKGIPNLWMPRSNHFYEISEIPLLGSGKINMAKINEMETDGRDN